MRSALLVFAFALLTPLAARAQDPAAQPPAGPPPPAEPLPPPPPEPPAPPLPPAPMDPLPPPPPPETGGAAVGPINFEALVDTYYQFHFTGDPSTQRPLLRAFDDTANTFTLGYAKLAASMNADPVGFRIDLGYGHTGAIINQGSSLMPSSRAGYEDRAAGLYGPALLLQQAYATAKLGMFTLDAGKFVTSASDEVIETKSNWNYSRSLGFNGVPFVHTGLRLGVGINEMLSVNLQVVNGWNNDPDINGAKTYGGQVAVTLAESKTNIFATTYIGKEVAGGETAMLFDLVVAQMIGETIGLSLNGDFYKNDEAQWWAVGLKGRFLLAEMFNLAARFEYLMSEKGGYATNAGMDDVSVYEGTLTGIIPIARNYEIRAEVRGDFSDKEIFVKKAEARKNQFTGLVGFLAWLP